MGASGSKLPGRHSHRFKKSPSAGFDPADWEVSPQAKQLEPEPSNASLLASTLAQKHARSESTSSASSLDNAVDVVHRVNSANLTLAPHAYNSSGQVRTHPSKSATTLATETAQQLQRTKSLPYEGQMQRSSDGQINITGATSVLIGSAELSGGKKGKVHTSKTKKFLHGGNSHSSTSLKTTANRSNSLQVNATSSTSLGGGVSLRRSSSSLQHISDRTPTQEPSEILVKSTVKPRAAFYSGIDEDLTSWETAKSLRKAMKIRYKGNVGLGGISDKKKERKSSITERKEVLKGNKCNLKLSNSCSTLFVDQTISRPDLEQIIFCAATAIHTQFTRVLQLPSLPKYDAIFDEKLHPLTSRSVPTNYDTRCPPVSDIFDFLRAFFKAAVLKADVAIVAMVYINRLQANAMPLQPANWKRMVLGAVMLASKVWDDQAVWNADFCTVLPDVSLDSMNELERKMLDLLNYNVSVTSGEYAQHYFDLRQCGYRAVREEGYTVSPLDVRKAVKLEAISLDLTDMVPMEEGNLKGVSCDDLFTPRRNIIIS
eukprot:comp16712_c0_seq1/m.14984 comp16712_c0_seq1/g.14984  ORF comp16712_c0_seq1/g.14984 comp16712_c0_seq1/m.14984 type:complete len:543 (-) comp16712_c0_seq1:249-1877(-)